MKSDEEYHDYSWLTMKPAESPYNTVENRVVDLDPEAQAKVLRLQIKDLRNQIKELRHELKGHIANCPFRELK
jgi:hypothetical protein